MGSKRPGGLNPIADDVLSSSDELAVYDKSTDRDLKATVAQLAVALKTVPGGTGATSLNGLSDVDAPTPTNLQVLQFDSSLSKDPPDPENPGAWTNATIAADTAKLYVVPTGGAQTPVDPLGGDPFSSLRFALTWVRANLRITTSLTIEFAAGTYNESNAAMTKVGGDGYLVILQAPIGATVTLADTSGLNPSSDSSNPGFISIAGRVNLTRLTITSTRWALNCERGVSATITDCTLSPTPSTPQIQLIQARDTQLRFSGQCVINGSCIFDDAISIANNGRLTVTTTLSPAITFRGNADNVIGTGATIALNGTGRGVTVSNANGIDTSSSIWIGGPVFTFKDGQPVRSVVAAVNGSTKVTNMVLVPGLPGSPGFPGTTDANTFYLIP
jgi:hypothetical protein